MAANLGHLTLAHDVGACVPLVLQNVGHSGFMPDTPCSGDIVSGEAVGRLVLRRSGDAPFKQGSDNSFPAEAAPGQLKYQPDVGRSLPIRLHTPVSAFPIAIGANLALILPAPKFHLLGALIFDGQVPAVELRLKILKHDAQAAGVAIELSAVKVFVEGNKTDAIQREHLIQKITGADSVAAKAAEILYDDAVDFSLPHHIQEPRDRRALEICPAVPVVHKFQDLYIFNVLHGVNILVEYNFLIFDTHAVHFTVLDGETDIKGNDIRGVIHIQNPQSGRIRP